MQFKQSPTSKNKLESFAPSIDKAIDNTLKAVVELADVGFIVVDSTISIVEWNEWMVKYSGISASTAIGSHLPTLFPIPENSGTLRAIHSALSKGLSSTVSYKLNRFPFALSDGKREPIYQHLIIEPLGPDRNENYCLIQVSDMSAAAKREKQLRSQTLELQKLTEILAQEKERAQVTLQSISDGVITTDAQGRIEIVNKAAECLTKWSDEEAKQHPIGDIFTTFHEQYQDKEISLVKTCLEQRAVVSDDELILIDRGGKEHAVTASAAPIVDQTNTLYGAVVVFRDETNSRQLAAQLHWQAKHDSLTGLMNRLEFENVLKRSLASAKEHEMIHSLLYIDLDQFKVVNDTCGHIAGDELLRQIATIFKKRLRNNDTLARLGGDEFAVLLESCPQENALRVANLLRQEIQEFRFVWQSKTFMIGISIGLVEITGKDQSSHDLLSKVDSACYVAKDTGRNRVYVHRDEKNSSSSHLKEMHWISRINSALEENRFCLYAQRISCISNNSKGEDHYEILIRMLSEENEIIPPGVHRPGFCLLCRQGYR